MGEDSKEGGVKQYVTAPKFIIINFLKNRE